MDKAKRKSRLLPSIQEDLIRQFVAGVPARTAAELTGVNRNTAILFFHTQREAIASKLAEGVPFLSSEVEVGEGYFGGTRKGKIHAVMIPDARSLTLMGIMFERIRPDSIDYTDSVRSYDVLDVSEFHHHRSITPNSSLTRTTTSTASRKLSSNCS
jgi:transposase